MSNAILIDTQHNTELIFQLSQLCNKLYPSKVVERRGTFPIRSDMKITYTEHEKFEATSYFSKEEYKEYQKYLELRSKIRTLAIYDKVNQELKVDLVLPNPYTDACIDFIILELLKQGNGEKWVCLDDKVYVLKAESVHRMDKFIRIRKLLDEGYRIIELLKRENGVGYENIPINRFTLPFIANKNVEFMNDVLYSFTFPRGSRTELFLQKFFTKFDGFDSLKVTDFSESEDFIFLDLLSSPLREREIQFLFQDIIYETEGNTIEDYFVMVQTQKVNREITNVESYFLLEGNLIHQVENIEPFVTDMFGFPTYVLKDEY
ncbi:hypothetical protein [Bacillus toyonensis]|uniref:hypothetical protein n=1 Tax=Bacillus toyonensis TaxID=155322 RepID=UPI000BF8275F|nr:hypothetical protein [Bacillus toyonensis]PGF05214.1 hypothetical protein COM61_01990 [Bacillus toyonensis]